MKTIKFSHVLVSFAVIAALALAAVPIAPAHAMSASLASQTTSLSATTGNHAPVLTSGAVVCRSITVWRHGHRITLRVCHRVLRQNA